MKGAAMLIAVVVGLVIGIVGAIAILFAALSSGNILIDAKVNTEDSNIVKALYMGKNLEKYSELSEPKIIEIFFLMGGPAFCGEVGLDIRDYSYLEISKWKDLPLGCDYETVEAENRTIFEASALEDIITFVMSDAFTKYARIWNVIITPGSYNFTVGRVGSKKPGVPTVSSEMTFEWKSTADAVAMTTALETGLEEVEKTYVVLETCELYNGTTDYDGTSYPFNIVMCN
ncbi:MAG: hypothetical protein GOV00_04490 [Candidatus Altiarchaeota archaeon]|nr:hypothetical protein [Candidatus Altiarchaeota archaeon]